MKFGPANWLDILSSCNEEKMIKKYRYKLKGIIKKWYNFGFSLDSISEKKIKKNKYRDLYLCKFGMSQYKYAKLTEKIFKNNIDRIKTYDKIKISFLLFDASLWCGDLLYQLFANDSKFDVNVLLFKRKDQENENQNKNFNIGLKGLQDRGINVIPVIDGCDENIEVADVLFYLTPYDGTLSPKFQFKNLPLDKMICYIHYGLVTGYSTLVLPIRYLAWKEFVFDKTHKDVLDELFDRDPSFSIYTGCPKIDYLYENKKIKSYNEKEIKTIIWAPHWAINDGVMYSTFRENYKFFLEYAKKNANIRWIVKPHPNLFFSAVTSGVFENDAEFRQYLEEWEGLSNAKVIVGGNYQESFCESDAMILDSSSFILEYQYVDKPMLFLRRDTQKFNELTASVIDASYSVAGDDLQGIENFINDVVLNGDDYKRKEREEIFRSKLDYYHDNGMLASNYIYEYIDRTF